jgi:hypothetical protein
MARLRNAALAQGQPGQLGPDLRTPIMKALGARFDHPTVRESDGVNTAPVGSVKSHLANWIKNGLPPGGGANGHLTAEAVALLFPPAPGAVDRVDYERFSVVNASEVFFEFLSKMAHSSGNESTSRQIRDAFSVG